MTNCTKRAEALNCQACKTAKKACSLVPRRARRKESNNRSSESKPSFELHSANHKGKERPEALTSRASRARAGSRASTRQRSQSIATAPPEEELESEEATQELSSKTKGKGKLKASPPPLPPRARSATQKRKRGASIEPGRNDAGPSRAFLVSEKPAPKRRRIHSVPITVAPADTTKAAPLRWTIGTFAQYANATTPPYLPHNAPVAPTLESANLTDLPEMADACFNLRRSAGLLADMMQTQEYQISAIERVMAKRERCQAQIMKSLGLTVASHILPSPSLEQDSEDTPVPVAVGELSAALI